MPVAKINTPSHYVRGRPAKYDVDKLAEHLLQWIEDDRHYNLLSWIDECKLDPLAPHQWAKINENFGIVWRRAKNKLAIRRNEMAMTDEMPSYIWAKTNHHYDVLHHAVEEEIKDAEAARRKDIEGAKPTQVIVKVAHDGLGSGTNVSTETLSTESNQSA